jgi:hypothetical protein
MEKEKIQISIIIFYLQNFEPIIVVPNFQLFLDGREKLKTVRTRRPF